LLIYLIGDDDLVLGFLDFYQFAELGGFAGLAFADDLGLRFKETDQFVFGLRVAIEEACAAFMARAQVPISTDAFTHKVSNPAWKTKPTWYMVASSDRSINPIQERMMAKRANATTVEVNASHVAYMSHPKESAKLIEDAATHAHVN